MKPLLFVLSAADELAEGLCSKLGFERGELSRRQFPDGETYLRLMTDVMGRDVVLLCTLDRPDSKVMPLLFAAAAARSQGARTVGLAAPYLAYMRQDKAFHPGEAVTSRTFASLLSKALDWLVTIDPHLHRYPRLDALYSIPCRVGTATDALALWIKNQVPDPVVVGPDEESAQWVERVAGLAGARSTVLRKVRSGDREVQVSAMPESASRGTPVIVDDIASSARTMIEAAAQVKAATGQAPVCVAVHGIFAADAYDQLLATGPAAIVSTNTVEHPSNRIDVSAVIAAEIEAMFAPGDAI